MRWNICKKRNLYSLPKNSANGTILSMNTKRHCSDKISQEKQELVDFGVFTFYYIFSFHLPYTTIQKLTHIIRTLHHHTHQCVHNESEYTLKFTPHTNKFYTTQITNCIYTTHSQFTPHTQILSNPFDHSNVNPYCN